MSLTSSLSAIITAAKPGSHKLESGFSATFAALKPITKIPTRTQLKAKEVTGDSHQARSTPR